MALPRITPRGTSTLSAVPAETLISSPTTLVVPTPSSTKLLNQARPLPKRNLTWTTSGNVIVATKEATVPNRFGVYPPIELVRSVDDFRPPHRINPLSPGKQWQRQYHALETVEPHFHNQQRSNLMKQREYFRYHTAWEKAFYGAPAEQENYRKHTREHLKQQMQDHEERERQDFRDKVSESIDTVRYDQHCRQQDFNDFKNKLQYLTKFRDENKKLMEWKEDQRRIERRLEQNKDREILRYNPINWSRTLK